MMTILEKWNAAKGGSVDPSTRITVKEALASPDAAILMPQVLTEVMRDAAEPLYIGSKLLQEVELTEGKMLEFPSVSAVRSHDVAELQEYPEETIDFTTYRTTEVRVGKVGLRLAVSEEMVKDSQWDVIGILVRKAGQAIARHKEEKIFRQFTTHGHTTFDNTLVSDPTALTTGVDYNGAVNSTLSTEDFIDMVIALMVNGYVATDVLMHPLVWALFAKNELLSSLSIAALGGENNSVSLNTAAVAGRLPMSIAITLSPFIPFDVAGKSLNSRTVPTFDMYVVDRNEIGVLLVKERLNSEEWNTPERDIRNIKFRERYGIGILNDGLAISVAKNIAFDKSWPLAQRVKNIS